MYIYEYVFFKANTSGHVLCVSYSIFNFVHPLHRTIRCEMTFECGGCVSCMDIYLFILCNGAFMSFIMVNNILID